MDKRVAGAAAQAFSPRINQWKERKKDTDMCQRGSQPDNECPRRHRPFHQPVKKLTAIDHTRWPTGTTKIPRYYRELALS